MPYAQGETKAGRGALLRRLAGLGAVAVLAAAAYWSLRAAYADLLFHRGTLDSVGRAIRLEAGNSRYHVRWAELTTDRGQARSGALARALALNRWDSALWIELGLEAEMAGDFSRAERRLLEAARVDKSYQPRGALANYYFRRGEEGKFWRWVREAVAMAYADPAPLFRMCWTLTGDAELILSRAIPDRVRAWRAYLHFLLAQGRLEAAAAVAERIIGNGAGEDVPLLLSYCDRLLESRNGEAAVRLWNRLREKGLIAYPASRPGSGEALTNGEFLVPPRSQGFDWRLAPIEGVAISRDETERGLRVSFTGKQPERCEVLSQIVALRPGRGYRFRYEYRTSGIAAGSGLRWRVFDLTKAEELLAESGHLSREGWAEESLAFTAPPALKLVRLALGYQRTPGTTRIEGSLSLRKLKLGPGR